MTNRSPVTKLSKHCPSACLVVKIYIGGTLHFSEKRNNYQTLQSSTKTHFHEAIYSKALLPQFVVLTSVPAEVKTLLLHYLAFRFPRPIKDCVLIKQLNENNILKIIHLISSTLKLFCNCLLCSKNQVFTLYI